MTHYRRICCSLVNTISIKAVTTKCNPGNEVVYKTTLDKSKLKTFPLRIYNHKTPEGEWIGEGLQLIYCVFGDYKMQSKMTGWRLIVGFFSYFFFGQFRFQVHNPYFISWRMGGKGIQLIDRSNASLKILIFVIECCQRLKEIGFWLVSFAIFGVHMHNLFFN